MISQKQKQLELQSKELNVSRHTLVEQQRHIEDKLIENFERKKMVSRSLVEHPDIHELVKLVDNSIKSGKLSLAKKHYAKLKAAYKDAILDQEEKKQIYNEILRIHANINRQSLG